jgi:hypothetical protein
VVKSAKTLKESELRAEFEALLRTLLGRVPFLKVESLKSEALLSSNRGGETERPDWLADVRAKNARRVRQRFPRINKVRFSLFAAY